ncbi:MAG: HNH endonuclease [Candidatus Levyibacteriota bacterium]
MRNLLIALVILIVVFATIEYFSKNPVMPQQSQTSQAQIGQRSKTSGCQGNGALQDLQCTPGTVDASLTKDVLCSATFTTKSVRNVPSSEKQEVYSEYGIPSHQPGQYEVDHLVSLELGGSNDIANLWPEAAEPRPGFHEKDLVENYLHKQVCAGSISLQDAQQKVATNWLQIFQSVPNIQNYSYMNHQRRSRSNP